MDPNNINTSQNQVNPNPAVEVTPPVARVQAPTPAPTPAPEIKKEVVEPKVVQGNKLKAFWDGFSPNRKKLVTIIGIVFIILIVLLFLSSLMVKKNSLPKSNPTVKPSPSGVSITPAPEVIVNPSRYATDSGVLSIEADLKKAEGDLNAVEINEVKLTPPNLYFDINFEK